MLNFIMQKEIIVSAVSSKVQKMIGLKSYQSIYIILLDMILG